MSEILARVRDIVREHAEVPGDNDAALELDSLALVAIAEALEESFGIRVLARDVVPANFATLGNIARFVESKMA